MSVFLTIQILLIVLAMITNIGLQAYAFTRLQKTTVSNSQVDRAKQYLLISFIMQSVAVVLAVGALILMAVGGKKKVGDPLEPKAKTPVKPEEEEQGTPGTVYALLIISALLLFVGGSIGAAAAVQLQCYRSDSYVQQAWSMSTISALIGILVPFFLLIVQAITKRKDIQVKYLKRATGVEFKAPVKEPKAKAEKVKKSPKAWFELAQAQMPSVKPSVTEGMW